MVRRKCFRVGLPTPQTDRHLIAKPFRGVGVGLRSRIFDSWSSWWNRDFPEFPIYMHIGLMRVG